MIQAQRTHDGYTPLGADGPWFVHVSGFDYLHKDGKVRQGAAVNNNGGWFANKEAADKVIREYESGKESPMTKLKNAVNEMKIGELSGDQARLALLMIREILKGID